MIMLKFGLHVFQLRLYLIELNRLFIFGRNSEVFYLIFDHFVDFLLFNRKFIFSVDNLFYDF